MADSIQTISCKIVFVLDIDASDRIANICLYDSIQV